jgi:hypothetical protein
MNSDISTTKPLVRHTGIIFSFQLILWLAVAA